VAIDRVTLARVAVLATALQGSCSPVADRCRAGTLLVAVTLQGGAVAADSLSVELSIDGGPTREAPLSHVPGKPAGNVEVQFPHGYPTGGVVAVVVDAYAGGALVGRGNASATLVAGCQATTLTVTPASDEADMAMTVDADDVHDLASGPDLSRVDAGPPPPDMVCPGGGVELCFNGLDDDCDGHIDCDDPDCAPVATCVPPVTGSFTYGTKEPPSGACPTGTSGAPVYQNSDLTGGGCTSTCSCKQGGCSGHLDNVIPCPGGAVQSGMFTAIDNSHCADIEDFNNFRASVPTGTSTCAQSGSAAPVTPASVPTTLVCADNATPVAGGCTGGQVCVPRGTQQCATTPGAGVACPAAYPTQTTWYTSFTDNRTCTCSCSTPGSCASAQVNLYDSKGCSDTPHPLTADDCSNGLLGAKIVTSGCALSVTLNNPLVFSASNARTVCCK
jgi:hypothetical protein